MLVSVLYSNSTKLYVLALDIFDINLNGDLKKLKELLFVNERKISLVFEEGKNGLRIVFKFKFKL